MEEQVALRQQRILEADPEGTAATESIEDYTRWKQTRHETLAQASQPSVSVQTVTALARTYVTDDGIQTIYASEVRPSRAGGRRFGTLVHSVLATINLDVAPEAVRAAVVANGRQIAATADEIADATIAVTAALNHPILRLAAAAECRGDLRRETPILLKREDSSLVEGVIDMAFRQQAPDFTGWTVVDFKTDVDLEASMATYTSQIALYVEAIKTATNLPARGILLAV